MKKLMVFLSAAVLVLLCQGKSFAEAAEEGATDEAYDAGYAWAEENDITDAVDCKNESASFKEGCEAYVTEMTEEEPGTGEEGY